MAEAGRKIDPVVAEVTRVYVALTRFAEKECAKIRCYGSDAVIPGVGKSPKDLASDTIAKLHARGWTPGAGEEDILPLGYVILKNLFTDLLRSSAYRTTVSLDSDEVQSIGNELGQQQLIELPLIIEKMKSRITDQMEKRYLEALLGGARTRKEFAEDLDVTPEEVTKIQNRLIYKAEKMRELW